MKPFSCLCLAINHLEQTLCGGRICSDSSHQRTQIHKLDSLECSNCTGLVVPKISLCPWRSVDNCTRPAMGHWVSALWVLGISNFLFCSECAVKALCNPFSWAGPNSQILQNGLSTCDPKYRPPETGKTSNMGLLGESQNLAKCAKSGMRAGKIQTHEDAEKTTKFNESETCKIQRKEKDR